MHCMYIYIIVTEKKPILLGLRKNSCKKLIRTLFTNHHTKTNFSIANNHT